MKYNQIFLSYGVLAFGALLSITGVAFVAMYVFEAIVLRAGEPDQSLLFWYLPILFLGLIGLVIGLGASIWGIKKLRRIRRRIRLEDARP